ncbi:hypothetical protein TTRE_0000524501 [Trichuris trichiura]|uniref:Uncharacterized protein n=1 Tax=Trichuris trichiura TaxID=36087 RepID=A0A077Z901_TRITR|nr:hypothetical protein TTRE_0000524501 [Trichuris trichiura]
MLQNSAVDRIRTCAEAKADSGYCRSFAHRAAWQPIHPYCYRCVFQVRRGSFYTQPGSYDGNGNLGSRSLFPEMCRELSITKTWITPYDP